MTNHGGYDGIIVKYDINGNVVWKKNFGGSSEDYFYSVTATTDGYIVGGYSYINSTGDWSGITKKGSVDMIIVKYDSNGNVLWKKNIGGSGYNYAYSVIATNDSYGVVGNTNSTGGYDFAGLTNHGGYDGVIFIESSNPITSVTPLYNSSFGIYNGTQQLTQLSQTAGTYIVKAKYLNTTTTPLNTTIIIAVYNDNKIIKTYCLPKTIPIDGVVDISQDVLIPSSEDVPKLKIKIMGLDSLISLSPLSPIISKSR